MIIKKLKANYTYIYFDNQSDFFSKLDELLKKGYQFSDRINLCVELSKDDNYYLLSFLDVKPIDENIKEAILKYNKSYDVIYPNFDSSILGIIASIRKYYGKAINYKANPEIDNILKEKKYNNIIIMLLDGMGVNILNNNLKPNSFLRKHYAFTNTAIYPSTTAASTTSTASGLSPIRTGWLGWQSYFKEIDRNIALFNGIDYYTDEQTGYTAYQALPYKPFYEDLGVNGTINNPDFKIKNYSFKRVLKKSLNNLNSNDNVEYVYYGEPDKQMHIYGSYNKRVKRVLRKMDNSLKWYAKKLPKDTLLIISADHGHTNVKEIELFSCKTIMDMLNRPPCNDSRCTAFSVKKEYIESFPIIFNNIFGYAYDIYSSSEAVDKGFFGLKGEKPHLRSFELLEDFVAIAKNEYYFNYKGISSPLFKSHHAGITSDEMLVPVIIYKK